MLTLAQTGASGAFSGATGNSANTVQTAPSFCTTPGTQTLLAAADNSVSQSGADALPNPTDTRLRVISRYVAPSSLNHRTFVRFSLPTRAGCQVESATLRLHFDVPFSGRTLDAQLVDPSLPLWGEAGFRYSTQPAVVGGTTVGYVVGVGAAVAEWTVTSAVQAQHAGNHNGFMIRDRFEDDSSGTAVENVFFSRDSSTTGPTAGKQPQLVLVWG